MMMPPLAPREAVRARVLARAVKVARDWFEQRARRQHARSMQLPTESFNSFLAGSWKVIVSIEPEAVEWKAEFFETAKEYVARMQSERREG